MNTFKSFKPLIRVGCSIVKPLDGFNGLNGAKRLNGLNDLNKL